MATKLTLILAGLAALLLLGGAVAAGFVLMDDDDEGEDSLSLDLAHGGRHSVARQAATPPSVVEADYELDNTGSAVARVTLTLTGPDGTVLERASKDVVPGKHVTIEVEHAFASAGLVGSYVATLVVDQGNVHVTEGGVDIDEREDGEEDEDE